MSDSNPALVDEVPFALRLDASAEDMSLVEQIRQQAARVSDPVLVFVDSSARRAGDAGSRLETFAEDWLVVAPIVLTVLNIVYTALRAAQQRKQGSRWTRSRLEGVIGDEMTAMGVIDYRLTLIEDFEALRRGEAFCRVCLTTSDSTRYTVYLEPDGEVHTVRLERGWPTERTGGVPVEAASSQLHRFLVDAFASNDELVIFLEHAALGLRASLPGRDVARDAFCFHAVDLLRARGYLGAEFFTALAQAFPRRATEVEQLARALGAGGSNDATR